MSASRVVALLGVLAALSTAGFVKGDKNALSFGWYSEYQSYHIGEHDFSCVVKVQAPKKVAAVRAPVSITAVLDASGSMQGLPIAALKNAAEYMVEALGPLDYLGVVTYNDFVYETVPLISVDFSVKPSIKASLRAIIAGGGTNLSTGLFAGIDQQKRGNIPYSKYVLLFTDGVPNGGIEDIGEIEFLMSKELEAKNSPVVYTLGFGYEQDPNFLYRIAHTGRGSYVFVNSPADIPTSFGQILGGLLSVYDHDIVCTLPPLGGSSIKRVQAGGYITPGRESWQVFFADLYAAERRDVLIDMKIPILITPKNKQEVLRVDVTYFDPFTGAPYSAKPIIVIIERTIVHRPLYIVPNPRVDTTRVRYRCAEDIEKAVILSTEGKYDEAKTVLDGTLAYIAASSVWNVEEVQQYREDCIVVQKVVKKKEVIPPRVAAGYIAGAHSIGNQRAAGVTNDLHGPAIWVTEPKQEEAKKAKEFAAPVLPANAQSTAVGFADATVNDDGTVTAEVNNVASVDGEDTSATSEASSTANGDGATAASGATAIADSGNTKKGSAEATAIAETTATGKDATSSANGDSTAVAGEEGDATATTTAIASAFAPVAGDAEATATGTSSAVANDGDATATTTTFASAEAPEGEATASANSNAFAQGEDATAAAPAEAFAQGDSATATSVGDATAFAGDEGEASATGTAVSEAQGVDSATATAAAPAFAFSGEDGSSVAVGNADAAAVASDGPADATGTADATAESGKGGSADATANGSGSASGTEATATGSGDALATAGEDTAKASGSGKVSVTDDSAVSSAEGTAKGDNTSASASASAVSGGPGGPSGQASGQGTATSGDATATASGTAEASAPAPAPEEPLGNGN